MRAHPKRRFRALPTGRPRLWTTELVLDAACEWEQRHGRLPRPTDWLTQRANTIGGEALERLRSPPACGPRWPAASTVNDLFGNWAQFYTECERVSQAPGASSEDRRLGPGASTAGTDGLVLLGDAGVIDDLRERWRACTHERDHCDEWRFAAWAVANGVAVLPNVETPTDGILPVYWYLRHIVGVVGRVHAVFPHP